MCSRSAAIKLAISEATIPELSTSIPDEREVMVLLGQAARSGRVAALREPLAFHREERKPESADSLAELDELARRRGRTV